MKSLDIRPPYYKIEPIGRTAYQQVLISIRDNINLDECLVDLVQYTSGLNNVDY